MPFLLLMPSYNHARFIADAIRSVLAQDDENWELWIVDNSSDETPRLVGQFKDSRIRYYHIAERMSPGLCLNWMLERAQGRDFAYIHSDNNLRPSFVRRMRAALATDPLTLAYCDMRTIDEQGRHLNVFRRGAFDLARLMSVDTLGVPFAATKELALRQGGFSVDDFADDVRFCVGAFGLARYVHVKEPLVDYRLHTRSRTEAAGGNRQLQHLFIDLMPKLAPTLEQRGANPIEALRQGIRDGLDDVDLFMEDLWHRKLSRIAAPWWLGPATLDHFFAAGLVDVQGFSEWGRPPSRWMLYDATGNLRVLPWKRLLLRVRLLSYGRDLRKLLRRPRDMLLTWAVMSLGIDSRTPVAIQVRSLDVRTLWAARQLQEVLGWTPLLHPDVSARGRWLKWGRATGSEPFLDCRDDIILEVPRDPPNQCPTGHYLSASNSSSE